MGWLQAESDDGFFVKGKRLLPVGAMGRCKDGEEENSNGGWGGKEGDLAAVTLKRGEKREVVQKVRCRGLPLGCSCTDSLVVLV